MGAQKEKMEKITQKQLLECGVHFGHQKLRWNPKMQPYILMEKNGIHVINLKKTLEGLEKSALAIQEVVANKKSILFVGTKKSIQATVRQAAESCQEHFVSHRWLGGMLTNFSTVRQSLKKLGEFEKMETDGTFKNLKKKQIIGIEKQKEKLLTILGGIRRLNRNPGLIIIVDTVKEHIAVKEANKLNIPIVAICDTNSNPEEVTYQIPGNDDSIKAVELITGYLANAINQVKSQRAAQAEAKKEEQSQAKATPKIETEAPKKQPTTAK